MSEIFLRIVNMSVSAGWTVLAVLLLRIAIRKAPIGATLALWAIVGVRMISPFSLVSVFSIIPSAETVSPDIMMDRTPQINTGMDGVNNVLNPIISGSFTPRPEMSANPLQIWVPIFAFVWVLGVCVMLAYTMISYCILKHKLDTAVLLRDNIYQSENVSTPFVFGLIAPKIYLPFDINESDVTFVAAHEKAHIERGDHILKPLGFALLALHWFNPLAWVGYFTFCKDIELACDIRVISAMENSLRADYASALLSRSTNKKTALVCPLAFGESGVKTRVNVVLSYKKPHRFMTFVASVLCVFAAWGLLTDPINAANVGINRIYAKNVTEASAEIDIKYTYGDGAYSVRLVGEDEGEYCGDGLREYDGSLGKYRIMVKLGDTEISGTLGGVYEVGSIVEIANSGMMIRYKYAYPEDHGVVIYFGFDVPVAIEETEEAELNIFGGTINISVKTK